MNKIEEFKIEHMDALSQGVSKSSESVTFIAKTLPGETGEAKIHQSKKGVQFAELKKLESSSPERIVPECKHFTTCTGCHYLHTNYQNELVIKTENFKRIFRQFQNCEFVTVGAPERLGYRNRLQLHYDFSQKKLGFINQLTHQIIEVPECLIGSGPIREKLRELYHKQEWLHLAKNQKPKGHVELYQKGDGVSLTWNQAYADGGFTQVNRHMNDILVKSVSENLKTNHLNHLAVLDLFAGNGNLTKEIAEKTSVTCVDFYAKTPSKKSQQQHIHLDLFHPQALNQFSSLISSQFSNKEEYSTLVLDPPRSGFKNLKEWSDKFKFEFILYVSCNPMTLLRDLETINQSYQVIQLSLLDLFPSTYHFESIALLKRQNFL